jgi:isoleucyl-tRNA synthetase
VRAIQKELPVKLRNVYSFFTIYANIDGFDPFGEKAANPIPFAKRPELDRWLLSELSRTTKLTTDALDAYDIYGATQVLTDFVDAMSNWWVRRSRDRFWGSEWSADKKSAYETLYEALVTVTRLVAPFLPFASEAMHQNLVVGPAKHGASQGGGTDAPPSVHLESYPADDGARHDAALSKKIRAVRDIVSVGLQVRTQHKLKVRQPLRAAHVIVNDARLVPSLKECVSMIAEELNVLEVHFVPEAESARYGSFQYKPNFRTLGQRQLGKQAQEWKKSWTTLKPDEKAALDQVLATGKGTFAGTELLREDIDAQFEAKEGFAAAGDRVGVVVLETKLDDELKDLGFLRELQNRVQTARKELGLEYTDRIKLALIGGDRTRRVVAKHGAELAKEVLAVELSTDKAPSGANSREVDVEGDAVTLAIARV